MRELEAQIRADAERQQAERARLSRTRQRSESDATELASSPLTARLAGGFGADDDAAASDVVAFNEEIVYEGVRFGCVRLFQSRKGASLRRSVSAGIHCVSRMPRHGVPGGTAYHASR